VSAIFSEAGTHDEGSTSSSKSRRVASVLCGMLMLWDKSKGLIRREAGFDELESMEGKADDS
jgi:hypothetical protein